MARTSSQRMILAADDGSIESMEVCHDGSQTMLDAFCGRAGSIQARQRVASTSIPLVAVDAQFTGIAA
jgi:hypothetical protein